MGVEDATSSFKRPRSRSPRCYSSGEKNCKRNIFFSFVPFKPGRDEPFKRPRSGSPRCYSFGEKNS
ncbi:hypothetical protein V1477_006324 [Vespula maculifrons]|uniref:Uncharacterized protein n=1 Tax=Vespula maculifrons TaxID=7453 RepID=A0ABD2CL85_VESMC